MRRGSPNSGARAVLQILLGAAVLHISLFSEMYLRYVRQALRPYLVASGVLLVLVGLVGAVVAVREALHGRVEHPEQYEHGDGDGHGHSHGSGPRIAWLLVLPVLAIFLLAPGALGAYTAQRSDSTTVKPAAANTGFAPLPTTDPAPLRLADFDARAVWDSSGSLKGRRVRLTGFATSKDGGGWYLTRLTITCCAADARSSKVEIRGGGAPPPQGSWVEVTGVWQSDSEAGRDNAIPSLAAERVSATSEPDNPYE
ncbi:TIGR03943 family protein [Kitasatospora sp. MAP5-34]|uniref:TIGR03943 family putative permease subunit n=1 Tax=Kitasatospora sp. MAP5-34 TaxID=3035102 RepID=UPI0024751958|nr:TIGR03943 family protein [Kitasatospora sp. MAP5-34]MDH6577835.1 putative repeat protein (TIGR03943 family) [Kitasatospora sp. MAP5-34]